MAPFLSVGFRPFFLLASLFAVVSVVVWSLVFRGTISISSRLGATGWHAHEMLFGFAAAVLAGFLLTAVQNWTKQKTADGAMLGGLAALWLLGRLATASSELLPPGLAAIVDVTFLPAVALVIAVPIARAGNRRNYGVPFLLLTLAAANVGMHLAALGYAPSLSRPSLTLALFVPLVFLVLIGGRVIPFFTGNVVKKAGHVVRDRNLFDALSIPAVLIALVLEVIASQSAAWALPAGLADVVVGLVVLARMWGWQGTKTASAPILWVLHLGYGLLGVGFVVLALARLSMALQWGLLLVPSTALHVLTIGGLGLLILGMISRVSLGHTGRPLVVGRALVIAFVFVVLAVFSRVLLPVMAPSMTFVGYDVTTLLWSLAFGIYAVVNLPILFGPRADQGR